MSIAPERHLDRVCTRPIPYPAMSKLRLMLVAGLMLAIVGPAAHLVAQNTAAGGWKSADWIRPYITDANRKPLPRRNLVGMWGPTGGPPVGRQGDVVRGPVPQRPTDAPRDFQVPYTAYGLEQYK